MRRISRLAYSLLTATTLHLAACGGDASDEPATFASASQVQKERALIAGAGFDAGLAMILTSTYASAGDAACPTVTRSGDTTTITGGCTLSSGDRLTGKATAKNLPSLTGGGYDPQRPIEITFDELRFDDTGPENDDLEIAGVLSVSPTGTMTAALALSIGGLEVFSDATWHHDGAMTSAQAGSTIELTGLGQAEIQGRWSMDSEAPAGALELHGADVLAANFAATVGGCTPITVDGKPAGEICESTDAE